MTPNQDLAASMVNWPLDELLRLVCGDDAARRVRAGTTIRHLIRRTGPAGIDTLAEDTHACLMAAFELARRRQLEKLSESPLVRSATDAACILAPYLRDELVEVFVVMLLDGRHRLMAIHNVSRGTMTSSLVHPREVFRPAVLAGSVSILVAHNHPSGDPTPSREDDAVTERLVSAGELLGIPLLDHVIIGEGYVSYREQRRGVLGKHERSTRIEGETVKENKRMWHELKTPAGPMGFVTSGRRVERVFLPGRTKKALLEQVKRADLRTTPSPVPRDHKKTAKALQDYWSGKTIDPAALPIQLLDEELTPFTRRVYEALREVPRGETVSYGTLAALAGSPGAARAVGTAMARNPFPLLVPCHRVLAGGKRLGGFGGPVGLGQKEQLLRMEGSWPP